MNKLQITQDTVSLSQRFFKPAKQQIWQEPFLLVLQCSQILPPETAFSYHVNKITDTTNSELKSKSTPAERTQKTVEDRKHFALHTFRAYCFSHWQQRKMFNKTASKKPDTNVTADLGAKPFHSFYNAIFFPDHAPHQCCEISPSVGKKFTLLCLTENWENQLLLW